MKFLVFLITAFISISSFSLVKVQYQEIDIEVNPISDSSISIKISNLPLSHTVASSYYWGRIRRDNIGDRLGGRDFWKDPVVPNRRHDIFYSKNCLDTFPELRTQMNFKLHLEFGEVEKEDWIMDWVLLSCLESRWYIAESIEKTLYDFFDDSDLHRLGYKVYDYYDKSWFANLARPKGEKASFYKKIFYKYFYSSYRYNSRQAWRTKLLEQDKKLENLAPKKFSKRILSKHTLMVTHATSDFDYKLKSKPGIDRLVKSFKDRKLPVVFLVNGGADESWFTKDRDVEEKLFSKWGEHNYRVLDEVTVVGGQWKNCLRVTIVDLITRHFLESSSELKINLAADAIYTDESNLLSETIFSLSPKQLKAQIERTSIFGGYRIMIDDPHDGPMEVDSDMNYYTGIPDVSEYSYDLYVGGDLVLSDIGSGSKKVIFNIH